MIIFLHGADTYRSREKLHGLTEAYLSKNSSSGFFDIDFSADAEKARKELLQALNETGLFATKKLIVIKRLLESSETVQQTFANLFQQSIERFEADTDMVIVVWEEKTVKKNAIASLLDKHVVKKQQFDALKDAQLEQWIMHRVRVLDAKKTIDRRGVLLLISEMGNDLYMLENELRNLVDFCDEQMIRESDVKVFVSQSVKSTIFEALEALSAGRKSAALDVFESQLTKGANALYLLSMCAWQLRNLLKVADMYTSGVRVAPAIAKQLKLHPFVVQKLLRHIAGFPLERLKHAFALLADLDMQVKNGGIEPKMAISMFVMKM